MGDVQIFESVLTRFLRTNLLNSRTIYLNIFLCVGISNAHFSLSVKFLNRWGGAIPKCTYTVYKNKCSQFKNNVLENFSLCGDFQCSLLPQCKIPESMSAMPKCTYSVFKNKCSQFKNIVLEYFFLFGDIQCSLLPQGKFLNRWAAVEVHLFDWLNENL